MVIKYEKFRFIIFILIISLILYSCAPYIHTYDGYEINSIEIHLRDGNVYENAYILGHNEKAIFLSRTPDGNIDNAIEISRQNIVRVIDEYGNDISKELLSTDYLAKNAHYTEQIHQLLLTVTLASGVILLVALAAILSADSD